jgi:hypothetical protein
MGRLYRLLSFASLLWADSCLCDERFWNSDQIVGDNVDEKIAGDGNITLSANLDALAAPAQAVTTGDRPNVWVVNARNVVALTVMPLIARMASLRCVG